jgi:hypothetical protein
MFPGDRGSVHIQAACEMMGSFGPLPAKVISIDMCKQTFRFVNCNLAQRLDAIESVKVGCQGRTG